MADLEDSAIVSPQHGNRSGHQRPASSDVMESSFEDTKAYVLTELGKQFVHYVMDDVVSQLGQNTTAV